VKCEYCELLDDCSNTTHYYVSASDQASITNNDVNEYKVSFREANWSKFDEFKVDEFKIWQIEMPHKPDLDDDFNKTWKDSTCSCPYFYKDFICKHIIGIAIRLKLCSPLAYVKDVVCERKKKRGAPKKNSKALLRK